MKITMANALRRSFVAAVLVASLAAPSVTAMAAALVSGSPQNVSVDAQNSSLKDILSALGKQFNVHYQSTANLDKQLSGTYEGSLRRVVARLLEGYNFIITTNQDMIEVTVLGTQGLQIGGAPSPNTRIERSCSTCATVPGNADFTSGQPGDRGSSFATHARR